MQSRNITFSPTERFLILSAFNDYISSSNHRFWWRSLDDLLVVNETQFQTVESFSYGDSWTISKSESNYILYVDNLDHEDNCELIYFDSISGLISEIKKRLNLDFSYFLEQISKK